MNPNSIVKKLRFEKKLTQLQLANAIGVSRQTIVSIESNKSIPSLKLAFKIAHYFEKSIEEVFFHDLS